ncbi:unnamed protein product [Discula destructiva]
MIAVLRPRLVITAALTFSILTSFYFFLSRQGSARFSFRRPADKAPAIPKLPYGRDYQGRSSPEDVNRVTNGTLGFGKVFVVGLPERSDKRDAIALASSLTGFDVEWVDGVRGETIPDKAVPYGVNRKLLMETNLGSWRGHMNAVRRIVEENLDSALIMEDDMDWDVRLKPQLELIATGTRAVLSSLPDILFPTGRGRVSSASSSSPFPVSPYGDDWDILWLGHCGEPFPQELPELKDLPATDPGKQAMSHHFTIFNDATVPPLDKVTGIVDFKAHPERTRWVHVTAAPICTFAYAVSLRGARKILHDLSVDRLTGPFDNALAGLCRRAVGSWSRQLARGDEDEDDGGDRGLDAKCLSVTPPLFFHHKARGLVSADSDIQNYGGVGAGGPSPPPEVRDRGSTENIVWSARLNLANMIMRREMESQW